MKINLANDSSVKIIIDNYHGQFMTRNSSFLSSSYSSSHKSCLQDYRTDVPKKLTRMFIHSSALITNTSVTYWSFERENIN